MEIIEFKGIRLRLDKDKTAEDLWIEACYDLPNGNCAEKRFVVLEGGQPTYTLISEALELFGKEVLKAKLISMQMAPGFATRYLYPAIFERQQQVRWN
jgi:hypothetical protein